MNRSPIHGKHAVNALAVFALAISFALLLPSHASADVRKADLVMGESVEARGLTIAQCPSIDAEFALVMSDDGTVYFSRSADEPVQIASITKIMTAVVALEHAAPETTVTVSEKAASIGESTASLQEGDVLGLNEAIQALMIPSGNDAAQAIAETIGGQLLVAEGGSDSDPDANCARFVQAMNETAAQIGMSDTLFENPHGLDYDEYEGELHSTAGDVALLCQHAMLNDTFRSIVCLDGSTITIARDGAQEEIELEPTDELLSYYEEACGVKTGYTSLAGACFAGAFNWRNQHLYTIVLNSSSEAQRFTDATTLFEWTDDHYIDYRIAQSSITAPMTLDGSTVDAPVIAEVAHADWLDTTFKATISNPDQTIPVFDLNGNISQSVVFDEVHGNVKPGDKVGTVTYKQRNEVIATVDLIACETCNAPGIFESFKIGFSRFLASFTGDQKVANSIVVNEMELLNDKAHA